MTTPDSPPSDVVMPGAPVRQHLIDMAVTFLNNPKVVNSPLEQKKAFLLKKGLTDDEIEMSVSQASSLVPQSTAPNHQPYPMQPAHIQTQMQMMPYSRWQSFRDIIYTLGVLVGLSYAAYRLYKKYFYPYLFGLSNEDKQMKKLEDSITELKAIVENMVLKMNTIQLNTADYHRSPATSGMLGAEAADWSTVHDIKSEIQTLKGLYLSRQQFPVVPKSTPIIPSWQLTELNDDTKDEVVAKKKEKVESTAGDSNGTVQEAATTSGNVVVTEAGANNGATQEAAATVGDGEGTDDVPQLTTESNTDEQQVNDQINDTQKDSED